MKRRNMVTLGYGDQRVSVTASQAGSRLREQMAIGPRETRFERAARDDLQRMAAGIYGPAAPVRVEARSADARRMAREETGFAFARAAVQGQRVADRALPRDGGPAEASARGHFVEIAGAGSERVRRRCSPIDDPAFKLDSHLRLAGQRFERIAAEAEGVERMRTTLCDAEPSADPDPDAARARAVRAHREYERIAGQIPALPAMVTPNGNLSEWQILQAVVIHRQSLRSVACGGGRRCETAGKLLAKALGRVEALLPEWAR